MASATLPLGVSDSENCSIRYPRAALKAADQQEARHRMVREAGHTAQSSVARISVAAARRKRMTTGRALARARAVVGNARTRTHQAKLKLQHRHASFGVPIDLQQ